MAASADMTIKVEADEITGLVSKIERLTRLELAFSYLLENTPCTCIKQAANPNTQLHDAPCKLAIAINIAAGLRAWPADDK